MKKVALLLVAAMCLAACHCERRTTGTPCRKAGCYCAKQSQCKCAAKKRKPAKAVQPVKKVAPTPAPAPVQTVEKKTTAQAEELNTVGNVNRQGNVINLSYREPIRFAHNSDVVAASSNKELNATAAVLKKYPNNKIIVKGYTDSLGDPNYNLDLSQRRAQAVADALVARGVPAANISAIGYGSQKPVATNKTAAGRAQNRRVELQIEVK